MYSLWGLVLLWITVSVFLKEISSSQLKNFNTEAMKCTALGVTIMVSSGDNGAVNFGCSTCAAGGATPENCACSASSSSSVGHWPFSNTWTGTGYFPSWPATSPYVTAVGATMGTSSIVPSVGQGERVCMSNQGGVITSGGGFSTYYAQPSWQVDAVNQYFKAISSQPSSGYNRQGRAIPDVSLLGVYYQVRESIIHK
jgi:subtilase family serine protease